MTKAWLRQVIMLCKLHSVDEEVVASMSNLRFKEEKTLRSNGA